MENKITKIIICGVAAAGITFGVLKLVSFFSFKNKEKKCRLHTSEVHDPRNFEHDRS